MTSGGDALLGRDDAVPSKQLVEKLSPSLVDRRHDSHQLRRETDFQRYFLDNWNLSAVPLLVEFVLPAIEHECPRADSALYAARQFCFHLERL